MTKPADPTALRADQLQTHPADPLQLIPHPGVITTIRRQIWSPYRGYGRLVGTLGTPPAFAHLSQYAHSGIIYTLPQHSGAFFVLN